MYIVYIYIYIMFIHIYMYVYIERERDSDSYGFMRMCDVMACHACTHACMRTCIVCPCQATCADAVSRVRRDWRAKWGSFNQCVWKIVANQRQTGHTCIHARIPASPRTCVRQICTHAAIHRVHCMLHTRIYSLYTYIYIYIYI